jgi:molecular chaperone GrpE
MEEQEQSTAVDTPENSEPLAGTELADLKQQNAELQDRLLRMQAEFDNFRKRTERERMEFAEYAGEMTVRALLPILDDFERALRASEGTDTELTRGIELIYSRFLDTLRKQGLEPIPAEGAQFDPHEHEAIGRVESNDHEDNTIVQEFQRGYRYKGRLLRPSMVQVAVKE